MRFSNNVVCVTSKGSDQPAQTRNLIRAFARRLNILSVKLLTEHLLEVLSLKECYTGSPESTLKNATMLEITCHDSILKQASKSVKSYPACKELHVIWRHSLFNFLIFFVFFFFFFFFCSFLSFLTKEKDKLY